MTFKSLGFKDYLTKYESKIFGVAATAGCGLFCCSNSFVKHLECDDMIKS